MKGFVLPAVVALAFAASAAMTRAEEAKPAEKQTAAQPADSNASSEQIIQQLTPQAVTPHLRFRGLHLLTSQPAATALMPAVGLDIKFKTNSAELTEDAKVQVKQLAEAMQSEQLSKYHFLVEGHTDNFGRPDYNLNLSKRRAPSGQGYLVPPHCLPPNPFETIRRRPAPPDHAPPPAPPPHPPPP